MSRAVSATPVLFYMRCLLGGKLLFGLFCVPFFFKGKQMGMLQHLVLKCCMSNGFILIYDLLWKIFQTSLVASKGLLDLPTHS